METVGSIQVVATINTKDYDAAKKRIEAGNNQLESSSQKTSRGFSSAWVGAIAGVASALTGKFIGAVKSVAGDAVKRVDTLNNSARTFQNMGIDAKDSAKSMSALEKSIKGLPTPLDSAVRGMTSLTATYGDIDKGQKVFSALNNAILGFGGSADMVDNAITQLSQLPMDGPLDAQTWNSLRNSGITPVLTAMAKDSGVSVSEMKEQFGKGELTVQDFTDRLLKMDKEGGGGLVSLEQIAKDSTKGIGTGFTNMRTAAVKAVGGILESIGSQNISNSFTFFGNVISGAGVKVKELIPIAKEIVLGIIDFANQVGSYLLPKLTALYNTFSQKIIPIMKDLWHNVLQPLIPVIGGALVFAIGLAIDALNIILTSISWFTQALKDGNPFILAAVTALGLLAGAFAITSAVNSARSIIGTFTKETIPAAIKQFRALKLLLETKITMPAIAVAAVLASLAAIVKSGIDAINAIHDTRAAIEGFNASQAEAAKTVRTAQYSNDPKVRERASRALSSGIYDGFASGGFTGTGPANEVAGAVHRGEFVFPKDAVDQRTGMPKILSNSDNKPNINQTNNIYTDIDMDVVNQRLMWEYARA